MDLLEPVQQQYRNFVPFADGYSPCFADWATGVVDDPPVMQWIASLPQISEVEVRSFSQEGARVRIAYYGEAPRLQAELAGLGLLLSQQEGDTWQLLRTGEVPSRDTPFGATSTSF